MKLNVSRYKYSLNGESKSWMCHKNYFFQNGYHIFNIIFWNIEIYWWHYDNAQKMKFSIKDFSSEWDQIRSKCCRLIPLFIPHFWTENVISSRQDLLHKCSFPLRISLVNVTKSEVSCGFSYIYCRNIKLKPSFFVQWILQALTFFCSKMHNEKRRSNWNIYCGFSHIYLRNPWENTSFFVQWFNPFLANVSILYPAKNTRKPSIFKRFQRVQNGNID